MKTAVFTPTPSATTKNAGAAYPGFCRRERRALRILGRGRVRRCRAVPGGGRRGSGALHSVRYNERSQPEVLERRSPTGIARERETRPNDPTPRQSHAYKPTHPQPRRITPTWSAGLRPASRGSAKLAPTTPTPRQSHACKPTHRQPHRITGTWSAGLRPASRGSAKPAPTTLATPISRLRTHAPPTPQNHGDMERRSPTGIARERETRTDNARPHANLTARSAGLRPAPLREAQRKPPKPKPA